jgi:hypothetical protein
MGNLSQVDPVGFRRRVAICKSSPATTIQTKNSALGRQAARGAERADDQVQ